MMQAQGTLILLQMIKAISVKQIQLQHSQLHFKYLIIRFLI